MKIFNLNDLVINYCEWILRKLTTWSAGATHKSSVFASEHNQRLSL